MNKLTQSSTETLGNHHTTEADDAIRGVVYLNTAVDREFAGLSPDESHHKPVVVMHPHTEADRRAEEKADLYDKSTRSQQIGTFVGSYLIHVEHLSPDSPAWPFKYAEKLEELENYKNSIDNKKS